MTAKAEKFNAVKAEVERELKEKIGAELDQLVYGRTLRARTRSIEEATDDIMGHIGQAATEFIVKMNMERIVRNIEEGERALAEGDFTGLEEFLPKQSPDSDVQ